VRVRTIQQMTIMPMICELSCSDLWYVNIPLISCYNYYMYTQSTSPCVHVLTFERVMFSLLSILTFLLLLISLKSTLNEKSCYCFQHPYINVAREYCICQTTWPFAVMFDTILACTVGCWTFRKSPFYRTKILHMHENIKQIQIGWNSTSNQWCPKMAHKLADVCYRMTCMSSRFMACLYCTMCSQKRSVQPWYQTLHKLASDVSTLWILYRALDDRLHDTATMIYSIYSLHINITYL